MNTNHISSRSSILFLSDLLTLVAVFVISSSIFKTQATLFFLILVFIVIFGNVIRDLYYFTHRTDKISQTLLQGLIIGYIPAFLFLYLYEICRQNCLHNPALLDNIILYCSLLPFVSIVPLAVFIWNKNSKDIIEGLYVVLIVGIPYFYMLGSIIVHLIGDFDISILYLDHFQSLLALTVSLPVSYITILCIRKAYYDLNAKYNPVNIIIKGNNEKSKALLNHIHLLPQGEFKLIGILYEEGEETSGEYIIENSDNITKIIIDHNIQLIVDCSSNEFSKENMKNIYYDKNNPEIIDFMSFYEILTRSIPLNYLTPQWIYSNINVKNRTFYILHKRLTDIITASIIVMVTSPVMLGIFIYSKLTDPGPFLYKQKRLGKNSKVFDCYKVRTMVLDAEKHTLGFQGCDNDPRITPIGKIIRPLRLDEIPQMINVIRGDISITGPRPDVPQWEDSLAELIPFHHIRRSTIQGWTGWAQINSGHSDTMEANKEKFENDLYYLKHCSLLFDLTVFFRALILATSGQHG